MATVRDKLWMFGVRAHDDDNYLGMRMNFTQDEKLIKWSRITPAEGAFMLDIPNILMVNSDGVPAPFSDDAYGYMESFCRMDRVLWSSIGSGGFRAGNEEAFVVELANRYPNVCGTMLDDFFLRYPATEEGKTAMKAELKEMRRKLSAAPRPMEIWVTLYTHQFATLDPECLEDVDGISLWTWNHEELPQLEENFRILEEKLPRQKKLLGVYLLDYPSGHVLTDEEMACQCGFGLNMLRQGRIDGILFCDNCVMGVRMSSEFWLRDWISKVKNIQLD